MLLRVASKCCISDAMILTVGWRDILKTSLLISQERFLSVNSTIIIYIMMTCLGWWTAGRHCLAWFSLLLCKINIVWNCFALEAFSYNSVHQAYRNLWNCATRGLLSFHFFFFLDLPVLILSNTKFPAQLRWSHRCTHFIQTHFS